mmetsp:Transcript_19043/g.35412  ORF Transcript_19043/g.35412 Transcript_19043/m.35412 type:complete len:278 (-) Transcript_19043:374-1207(-)
MNDAVGVHVVHTVQQLLRPGLHVVLRQPNFGRFQNSSKVIFEVLKHHEHILRDLGLVFRSDNFLQRNNVVMVQRLKDLNFAQGRDGKSVGLLLGVDPLERNDFASLAIRTHEHTPISALPDLVLLLEDRHVPELHRRRDRHRPRPRPLRPLLLGRRRRRGRRRPFPRHGRPERPRRRRRRSAAGRRRGRRLVPRRRRRRRGLPGRRRPGLHAGARRRRRGLPALRRRRTRAPGAGRRGRRPDHGPGGRHGISSLRNRGRDDRKLGAAWRCSPGEPTR